MKNPRIVLLLLTIIVSIFIIKGFVVTKELNNFKDQVPYLSHTVNNFRDFLYLSCALTGALITGLFLQIREQKQNKTVVAKIQTIKKRGELEKMI